MVLAIHGWENNSITFTKYESNNQHGKDSAQPKKLEKIPKKDVKNPKIISQYTIGRIKRFVIGDT